MPLFRAIIPTAVCIAALGLSWTANAQVLPARLPVRVPARTTTVAAGDLSGGVILSENRELKLKLETVRKLIADKNYSESVQFLGNVLGDPAIQDFFLKPDGQQKAGASFKAELRRTLASLPAEGRQTYELQYGAT